MKIYRPEDAIEVVKDNRTHVFYRIFDEYEMHFNIIPPKSIQEWHRHNRIDEALLVTKGAVLIHGKDPDTGEIETVCLGHNMMVRFENTYHTVENVTEEPAEFIVVRTVPDGTDKREIIKNDKEL